MIIKSMHVEHLIINRKIENFAGNGASLFAPNLVILLVNDWRVH